MHIQPKKLLFTTLILTAVFFTGFSLQANAGQPAMPNAADFGGRILFTKLDPASGTDAIFVWQDGKVRRATVPGRVVRDDPDGPIELERHPAWSPDFTQFAYVRSGDSYSDLFVANADGSDAVRLTNNFDRIHTPETPLYVDNSTWAFAPAWRPNGRRITYLHDAGTDVLVVWTMSSDGDRTGGARLDAPINTNINLAQFGWEHPVYSPVEPVETIMATNFSQKKPEVWVYSIDQEEWKPLLNKDEADYDAVYSPDGRYIAYTARVQGKTNIWLARSDGSGTTQLTRTDHARTPAWSPDGKAIAYLNFESGEFSLNALKIDLSGTTPRPEQPQRLSDSNLRGVSGTGGLSWGKLPSPHPFPLAGEGELPAHPVSFAPRTYYVGDGMHRPAHDEAEQEVDRLGRVVADEAVGGTGELLNNAVGVKHLPEDGE